MNDFRAVESSHARDALDMFFPWANFNNAIILQGECNATPRRAYPANTFFDSPGHDHSYVIRLLKPGPQGSESNGSAVTTLYMEYWSDGVLEYWKKKHLELLSRRSEKTVFS
jgi:hypothetical protein